MPSFRFVPIIGLAILNGIFSPFLTLVFAFQGLWYPFFMPTSLPTVFMLSSLLVSTLTLMIGGVPAALYERLVSNGQPSMTSAALWFASVALLTLPAMGNIMTALGIAT
jgi:hypothetical protein